MAHEDKVREHQAQIIKQMIRDLTEALDHLDHPATTMSQMLNTSSSAIRVAYMAGQLRGPTP